MSEKTTYVFNYDEPRITQLESALEHNTKVLSDMSKELSAERARTDKLALALEQWRACYFGQLYRDPDAPYTAQALTKFGEQDRQLAFAESGLLAALSEYRTARGAQDKGE